MGHRRNAERPPAGGAVAGTGARSRARPRRRERSCTPCRGAHEAQRADLTGAGGGCRGRRRDGGGGRWSGRRLDARGACRRRAEGGRTRAGDRAAASSDAKLRSSGQKRARGRRGRRGREPRSGRARGGGAIPSAALFAGSARSDGGRPTRWPRFGHRATGRRFDRRIAAPDRATHRAGARRPCSCGVRAAEP